jgi:hypothetical protein
VSFKRIDEMVDIAGAKGEGGSEEACDPEPLRGQIEVPA